MELAVDGAKGRQGARIQNAGAREFAARREQNRHQLLGARGRRMIRPDSRSRPLQQLLPQGLRGGEVAQVPEHEREGEPGIHGREVSRREHPLAERDRLLGSRLGLAAAAEPAQGLGPGVESANAIGMLRPEERGGLFHQTPCCRLRGDVLALQGQVGDERARGPRAATGRRPESPRAPSRPSARSPPRRRSCRDPGVPARDSRERPSGPRSPERSPRPTPRTRPRARRRRCSRRGPAAASGCACPRHARLRARAPGCWRASARARSAPRPGRARPGAGRPRRALRGHGARPPADRRARSRLSGPRWRAPPRPGACVPAPPRASRRAGGRRSRSARR